MSQDLRMSKKLLIVTGPQGAGNHLWSKIFAESPEVQGWEELRTEYWLSHGLEPFSDVWKDPSIFLELDWPHTHYVTNTSCPFIWKGSNGSIIDDSKAMQLPDYDKFIDYAKKAGFDVKVAIISRDKNILQNQQMRVRLKITLPVFMDVYKNTLLKYNPVILSTESLFLYRDLYLQSLSQTLDFPISVSEEKLEEILKDDSNQKYINFVNKFWLDDWGTRNGRRRDARRQNTYIYRRPNAVDE